MGDLFQNFDLTSCKRFLYRHLLHVYFDFVAIENMYCWKKIINNATNKG